MAMQAARFIVLDDLEDGDEIEVEASEDASNIQFRKGDMVFTLTAHEFPELIYGFTCVDRYIERANLRQKAH